MKESRRMKRMARGRQPMTALSLTSLMDIFTILLLYLLVNQSDVNMEPPQNITLPESIVENKPRETLTVAVSDVDVIVQGEVVATMDEVKETQGEVVQAIRDRMRQIRENALGLETQEEDQNREVTVMADQTVQFQLLKRIMASCTAAGYTKISLAVNQK